MQNKYIKYTASISSIFILAFLSLSILLVSCKKEETNNAPALFSFGPMPVARGAELKFVGKNLDQVTSIVLPGGQEITTFASKSAELITLTVPQDATPGLVTIKTSQGDITTKTPIGYFEPISIASFAPTEIKAGSELTITGDYLNLVKEVILTDRVSVKTFTAQTRSQLKLIVPAEAQTGKITLSNGAVDPTLVYSATALTVTLPAFTSVTPIPVKAGSTLTIAGTNLDLVKSVTLGSTMKKLTSFTSQSATQIVLTVPDETHDGAIIMAPASGFKVQNTKPLTMIVPTVAVTPTTLKNGAEITVTGTDLDLISSVTFGGGKVGTIKTGGTSTQIIVTSPNDAVSGVVSFATKAEKTVTGPSLTFVDPVFTSFDPSSQKAKADITISGTDLDLVTDVTFTGGVKGVIGTRSETQLTVKVPVGAKTGKITLTTKNGKSILSPSDITILANLPNFSSFSEIKATPNAILTLNGTSMSLIKQIIFPGNVVATDYGAKSDTKVEVYVPYSSARGNGQIKIVTYEGEEGLLPSIYVGGTDPVVNQTLCFFNFDGKNSWWGNAMGSDIKTDAASSSDGTSYWNINGTSGTGWWDGLFFRNGNNDFVTTGVEVSTWAVRFDVNVREAIFPGSGSLKIRFGDYYYSFNPWESTPSGYMTVGWITVTCPLTGFVNDKGVVIPSAATGGAEFGMVWSGGKAVKINMGIDNLRFEKIP